MNSLQGHFLVASPKLVDPNFFRTIVLVVQHNEEGALGLVLNRPLDMTIGTAWEQVSESPCAADGNLHRGGPCEGPLMVLHTDEDASEVEVASGVHFTTDRDAIERLVGDADHGPLRFFVGYAGWGRGQLESEMEEGSWMAMPASVQAVFTEDEERWQGLMKQIMRSAALPGVNPKCVPEDPSMN